MQILTTIRKNVPNFFTSLSLLTGSLSIIISVENPKNLAIAAYLILVAAVFDFVDGFAARLLDARSELGKQLDSLSDLISFGVAPSVILYVLLKQALEIESFSFSLPFWQMAVLMSAFLVALFSAFRLAKFNIDTRQTSKFIGLPTPASALLIASLPLSLAYNPDMSGFLEPITTNIFYMLFVIYFQKEAVNVLVLLPIILFLSWIMVSNFQMFSLKFKNIKFKENVLRYTLVIAAIPLVIVFQPLAIFMVIMLYILLNVANNLIWKIE
ncbi:MAG TPA: hypothetical protein DCQ31_14620 [Bacteroidales bacterium]|nr:hypothetical protein [Bacteroidales bacterium]